MLYFTGYSGQYLLHLVDGCVDELHAAGPRHLHGAQVPGLQHLARLLHRGRECLAQPRRRLARPRGGRRARPRQLARARHGHPLVNIEAEIQQILSFRFSGFRVSIEIVEASSQTWLGAPSAHARGVLGPAR